MATRLLALASLVASAAACELLHSNFTVTVGESVRIPCRFRESFAIWKDGKQYTLDTRAEDGTLLKMGRKGIILTDASLQNSGKYIISYPQSESEVEFTVNVLERIPVSIRTNMESLELIVPENSPFELVCEASGVPEPTLEWEVDRRLLLPGNDRGVQFKEGETILSVASMTEEREGTYSCVAQNGYDIEERNITVRMAVAFTVRHTIVVVIGLLVLVGAGVLAFVYFRVWRPRRRLQMAGSLSFERGEPENLNPDLSLSEQAKYLSYDRKWEFPLHKIKLGRLLGSGFYGQVYQARVRHIIGGEALSTAAVRACHKATGQDSLNALALEIKIMTRLDRHLNLVSLLGACTRNISSCELLAIVEFCPFGNLRHHLKTNRINFENEVDETTGDIGYFPYLDSRTQAIPVTPKNEAGDIVITVDAVKSSAEAFLKSKQELRQTDRKERPPYITSRDLVFWIYQVASGMEYLSSRKVLHGNLAARNVLLAQDKVVKLCDFGLARHEYTPNYSAQKTHEVTMAEKWMAPESIKDHIYTTQSDVWAFGVVVWEIFAMGAIPYPSIEAEHIYNELKNGYRLQEPENSVSKFFKLAQRCWQFDPKNRPPFTTLVMSIGNLLEKSALTKYDALKRQHGALDTTSSRNNVLNGSDVQRKASPLPSKYRECTASQSKDSSRASTSPTNGPLEDKQLDVKLTPEKSEDTVSTHSAKEGSDADADDRDKREMEAKQIAEKLDKMKFHSSLEHPGVIILTTPYNAVRRDPLPPLPGELPTDDNIRQKCANSEEAASSTVVPTSSGLGTSHTN